MIKITLADFIDVVSTSGSSKATKVSRIKNRKPYTPQTDFYKGVRDNTVDILQNSLGKKEIDKRIKNVHIKKRDHYISVAEGFKKWCGRKKIAWFDPPRGEYGDRNILVRVNPELGLILDNEPFLVKLYFKADKLPNNYAMVSTHLLNTTLNRKCPNGTTMCVLDVRRGHLLEYSTPSDKLDAALKGELAYISAIWDSV